MRKTGIIISFLITAAVCLLSAPLYSVNGLRQNLFSPFVSQKAVLEIVSKTKGSRFFFDTLEDAEASSFQKIETPVLWGTSVDFAAKNAWQEKKAGINIEGGAFFYVRLRGEFADHLPGVVDFGELIVNGKKVFDQERAVWASQPYAYLFYGLDGDKISVSFSCKKHKFSLRDLTDGHHFSWPVFFVVFIVEFFVVFKIVSVMSRYLKDGKNLYDVLFLCVFFGLLFLPMTKINTNTISKMENRKIAPVPVFFLPRGINVQYGSRFDAWFSDRFRFRKELISLYARSKKINRFVVNGHSLLNPKTYWMFDLDDLSAVPLTKTQENDLLHMVEQWRDFGKQNGFPVYFLLVPSKSVVYADQAAPYRNVGTGPYAATVARLQKKAGIPVIYPKDVLKNGAQKDFVYFKTDLHWTEWGAYLGYRALMDVVTRDFPDVPLVDEKAFDVFYDTRVRSDWYRNFHVGRSYALLNIPFPKEKVFDALYKYYRPKQAVRQQLENVSLYRTKRFFDNPAGTRRAVLVGSSMSENLLQFLPYGFSELKYFRLNGVKNVPSRKGYDLLRYRQDITSFNPDMMIVCLTESNFAELLSKD